MTDGWCIDFGLTFHHDLRFLRFHVPIMARVPRTCSYSCFRIAKYIPPIYLMSPTLNFSLLGLDPPLVLYFPRVCLRTLLRLLRVVPPCSPGCEESFREVFFSSDSILWWCLSNHGKLKKRETAEYRVDNVWVGGKRRRFGGWGGELKLWLAEVESMDRSGDEE